MNLLFVLLVPIIAALAACTTTAPPRTAPAPEFLSSPQTTALKLPFSEAVRVGDLLFLSGQLGNVPGKPELVPGGIGPETTQTLANIRAILARNGATLDDVVKCTAFLADMREWPAFNAVYAAAFARHFPARSALGATGLALGARVELECVAWAPAPRR